MASLDAIEFFQALLTTFFLTSIFVLVPKLLAALSTTSQSPVFSGYVENLYRHNPFHQWMAERQLARRVTAARFRGLDERTGTVLTSPQYRPIICPNKKWFLLSLIYVLIYVFASIAGALTIVWQESIAAEVKNAEDPLYPGFPVTEGQEKMKIRNNCKYHTVHGSGDPDKVGFVIYQLCLDVFKSFKGEKLLMNEVRAVTTFDRGFNNKTEFWKMTWSLETITRSRFDEYWRVSPGNEDRLEEAKGETNYLEECNAECRQHVNASGLEFAMIQEALKKVGMVKRRLRHYDPREGEFREQDELKDRKTRLNSAAWISMLAVMIVALLWSVAGLIKSDDETDFAMLTRLVRSSTENGPTTFDSVLGPAVKHNSGFIETTRKLPRHVVDNFRRRRNFRNAGSSDGNGNLGFRSRDVDLADEESRVVILRVADFAYMSEHRERAKDGMIFVARRFDEEDYLDDEFEELCVDEGQEEDLSTSMHDSLQD